MIFESMWPLAFLLAVPAIIILYLLRPKGRDYRISSNLLWKKLLKNNSSKTFLEKFVQNILMYLQILIIIVLVLALMSPFIRREGGAGNAILVIDTSGSMQHDCGDGKTRLEAALDDAKSLIAASSGTFSILTADCTGTELLAVGSSDHSRLSEILDAVECSDGGGGLSDALGVAGTLRDADGSGDTVDNARLIVYTDGQGAKEAKALGGYADVEIAVYGGAVSNVSNNFLSYTEKGGGYEIAAGLTNYSDAGAHLEVALYEGDRLCEIREADLAAGETKLCFFDWNEWDENALPLSSEIRSVRFDGVEDGDSLAEDNISYAIPDHDGGVSAVLVGSGNIYIEKAYQAVAGAPPDKVETDADAADASAVLIYDAGSFSAQAEEGGAGDGVASHSLIFAGDVPRAEKEENVMLSMEDCGITEGISGLRIGVNETYVYDVPEWATAFLWAGDRCAGYYGEHDGVRQVVVGFDVRESDFPLMAEFPVFIANAIDYLGDGSLLAENIYEAGEKVLLQPSADTGELAVADTRKAGLYEVKAGDVSEPYIVRFDTAGESDGRIVAESAAASGSGRRELVKKRLRNVLLCLALLLLIAEWIIYVRQMRYKGKFYLAVRIGCLLLLLGALFGVTAPGRGVNTTVFLADLSYSNDGNMEEMEDFIGSAVSAMPKNNQYGIVAFGRDAQVEQFLTSEPGGRQILSLPDKSATDLQGALSRALAIIPDDGAGRVVFLTDGRQTKGDIASLSTAIASRHIEMLAYMYENASGEDAYIENVEIPGTLHPGDAYSVTVSIESNYDAGARLTVTDGSGNSESHDIRLSRGSNSFSFRRIAGGGPSESLDIQLSVPGDTCAENDVFHAYSAVDAAPRLLLVRGANEDSGNFESLLNAAGCDFDVVPAELAPDSLEDMTAYRAIVLENVFISDLPDGFLDEVETYVGDYGCGIACIGGRESYALGGYRDSVLERVLPVDMELRGVDEVPPSAMVMVIDRSGSMSDSSAGGGISGIDLAAAAAEAAVDEMRESDYVGIVTFDDKYSWLVQPEPCSDKDAIKEKIETITEGGGTTIKPALLAALDGILQCEAQARHVILLTDGMGETQNFNDVIERYRDEGVTLSTVAVGDSSDQILLERLADGCGGRYYYSDYSTDIPKIFAQEVFLSGDTYLQDGTFGLSVNTADDITRGLFEAGWPDIYGYVSTSPKSSSKVLAASDKDDPVLAVSQYGMGHTAAWTTDVTNQWTGAYAGNEDYVQLWRRIMDYCTGDNLQGEDSADVTTVSGETHVTYNARDYTEDTAVEAVYTDPDGGTFTVPFSATAPGKYEAELDTERPGIYQLGLRRKDGGGTENTIMTAAVVQYSDEYRFDVSSAPFEEFIGRYGRMTDKAADVWSRMDAGARERRELAGWLIALAILWFLADVAMRRFCFRPGDTRPYRRMADRLRQGRSGKMPPDENPPKPAKDPAADSARAGRTAADSVRPARAGDKKASGNDSRTLDTSELLKKKDRRGSV